MDIDWVSSAAGRRVLVHWADPRPAWLWSSDGNRLLWRNSAARFFGARLKKYGLKLAPAPVPIKGQVARLIRLGSLGRSSLARVQFLAGSKPVSSTCTATPLQVPGDGTAVLLVGVDPIDAEILTLPEANAPDTATTSLLPPGSWFVLIAPDGRITGGSESASAGLGQAFDPSTFSEGDLGETEIDGETRRFVRLKASPQGHKVLLIEGRPGTSIEAARAEEGAEAVDADRPATAEGPAPEEPLLPLGLPPLPKAEAPPPEEEPWVDPIEPPSRSLSSLFDRLAGHDELFGELSADDEHFVPAPVLFEASPLPPAETAGEGSAPVIEQPAEAGAPDPDAIAAIIEFEDDLHNDHTQLYRVTGRGFTPDAHQESAAGEPAPAVDQESRRNFSELGRLLADSVANGEPPTAEPAVIEAPIEPSRTAAAEGALINIAAETFILNRLPLGILVFRDQQVLFANRALTDLLGHETIDSLRNAGLGAIFPGEDQGASGPVTHLARRDGTFFPVTARLQSITWQGRPALMLSAAPAEQRLSHEAAVRSFAELLAELRDEGFVAMDRSGKITLLSARARAIVGREEMEGEPLSVLVHQSDIPALRTFLERPARFAETARPSVTLNGVAAGTKLVLFAEGQAGIVTGYFGVVQRDHRTRVAPESEEDAVVDPSMLARVSRGVRRPLNTIIGFADLIRSAAFGAIENHRYLEYARDIKTSGQEIAVLVDELDDYTRLRAGSYATRPADLDLAGLLESCLLRVRGQANAARVLVRSAVSERLPRIRADRASLGQAVLNLLASAIDQSPPGGTVILSAQPEEDGSIAVNIRDSGAPSADPGERFVVFRDGVGKDGEALAPVRSSVGLALTRSLVAVNACTLSVAPAGAVGTLFSLAVPADLVATARSA